MVGAINNLTYKCVVKYNAYLGPHQQGKVEKIGEVAASTALNEGKNLIEFKLNLLYNVYICPR